jgi:hypothetical protein
VFLVFTVVRVTLLAHLQTLDAETLAVVAGRRRIGARSRLTLIVTLASARTFRGKRTTVIVMFAVSLQLVSIVLTLVCRVVLVVVLIVRVMILMRTRRFVARGRRG